MTSEVRVFSKDKIKLNVLQEVLDGKINLALQFGGGDAQDYASAIHENGKRVYVCGKFNLSEDANGGDTLTVRPIMIDAPLKILLRANARLSGKKASIVRNATKSVEQEYEISGGTTSIELIPCEKQSYTLHISNDGGVAAAPVERSARLEEPRPRSNPALEDAPAVQTSQNFAEAEIPTFNSSHLDNPYQDFDLNTGFGGGDDRFESFDMDSDAVLRGAADRPALEPEEEITARERVAVSPTVPTRAEENSAPGDDADLAGMEREITAIERQQRQLSQKKQSAIEHLEKLEAEYKKDYASLERELAEYKARMEADEHVIAHYRDQDVTPIEAIFREIALKLDEAENQIRFFIEAKQRKTMEIESEIKANKK